VRQASDGWLSFFAVSQYQLACKRRLPDEESDANQDLEKVTRQVGHMLSTPFSSNIRMPNSNLSNAQPLAKLGG
jgi:hypothetical protein